MSSRDKILDAVKSNQPGPRDLPPDYSGPATTPATTTPANTAPATTPATTAPGSITPDIPSDLAPQFINVLESIGGAAFLVSSYNRIATILHEQFPDAKRIVTSCPQLSAFAAASTLSAAITSDDPHSLETVDLAILPAHFGVAENGACWITESQMIQRVLPFITQHLALVTPRAAIVATLHHAYDRIAELETSAANPSSPYGFATFIAGPSKTADIEQSLVLGAHGPRSLTVFLLDENLSDAGFY